MGRSRPACLLFLLWLLCRGGASGVQFFLRLFSNGLQLGCDVLHVLVHGNHGGVHDGGHLGYDGGADGRAVEGNLAVHFFLREGVFVDLDHVRAHGRPVHFLADHSGAFADYFVDVRLLLLGGLPPVQARLHSTPDVLFHVRTHFDNELFALRGGQQGLNGLVAGWRTPRGRDGKCQQDGRGRAGQQATRRSDYGRRGHQEGRHG